MCHKIRLLPLNDLTLDHVLIFSGRIDLFFCMAASDLLSKNSWARSSAGDRSIIGNLLLQKGNQSNPVHSYGNLSLRNPELKICFPLWFRALLPLSSKLASKFIYRLCEVYVGISCWVRRLHGIQVCQLNQIQFGFVLFRPSSLFFLWPRSLWALLTSYILT